MAGCAVDQRYLYKLWRLEIILCGASIFHRPEFRSSVQEKASFSYEELSINHRPCLQCWVNDVWSFDLIHSKRLPTFQRRSAKNLQASKPCSAATGSFRLRKLALPSTLARCWWSTPPQPILRCQNVTWKKQYVPLSWAISHDYWSRRWLILGLNLSILCRSCWWSSSNRLQNASICLRCSVMGTRTGRSLRYGLTESSSSS